MRILNIYVPTKDSRLNINPRAAIVGEEVAQGRVDIHFEGNVYGVEHLKDFGMKLRHAGGRYISRYPTIASAIVKKEELIKVGEVWFDRHLEVVQWEITNGEAFEKWMEGTLVQ